MNNNHVFIIVPVYNVQEYLHRCLDSVLNQTYTNFSLILVDDGSTDDCPAICDDYEKKDSRVSVIHQKNGGLSAARNAGIDRAFKSSSNPSDDWIACIDSDDWIHERYLEILLDSAVSNNTQISVCKYYITSHVPENNIAITYKPYLLAPEKLWLTDRTCTTMASCKIYKLSLFQDIRYPVGKLHEDEYVTYRLLFACNQISVVDNKLYYYFQNENGIMHSNWTLRRLDSINALKQQRDYFRQNNYQAAYFEGQKYLLQHLIKMLRRVEIYYPERKDIRKSLKKDIKNERREYARLTNSITAFRFWLKIRYIDRLKLVISSGSILKTVKRKLRIHKKS